MLGLKEMQGEKKNSCKGKKIIKLKKKKIYIYIYNIYISDI